MTTGFFDDAFATDHTGRYDAVYLDDVIEHVRDPHAMLVRVKIVLDLESVLWLSASNINSLTTIWFQMKPRNDLLYFMGRSGSIAA